MESWRLRLQTRKLDDKVMDSVYDAYSGFFGTKLHVGGKFKLSPKLSYEGGTVFDIDWVEAHYFDLRDVDEFALRNGYEVGSKMLYLYTEQQSNLEVGLDPLLCEKHLIQFRAISEFERFLEMYIESYPCFEVWKAFSKNCPLRTLNCERGDRVHGPSERYVGPIFYISNRMYESDSDDENESDDGVENVASVEECRLYREGDVFDTELDEEVLATHQAHDQQRIAIMMLIAKENEEIIKRKMVEQGLEASDFARSKPVTKNSKGKKKLECDSSAKNKIPGRYARHGIMFKERKAEGYEEICSDRSIA